MTLHHVPFTPCLSGSHPSRPVRAIFTTSGWPLLTHHGRPLSSTGFSSQAKNDNRHPRGVRGVAAKRVVPRSVHFCLRVHRAPMASRARGEGRGETRLFPARRVEALIKMHEKRAAARSALRVISRASVNNGRQLFPHRRWLLSARVNIART